MKAGEVARPAAACVDSARCQHSDSDSDRDGELHSLRAAAASHRPMPCSASAQLISSHLDPRGLSHSQAADPASMRIASRRAIAFACPVTALISIN